MSTLERPASSAESTRTPVHVNEILSYVGQAVTDLEDLATRDVPGGAIDVIRAAHNTLNVATGLLLAKAQEYEIRRQQLEEQERQRQAAANPLVRH